MNIPDIVTECALDVDCKTCVDGGIITTIYESLVSDVPPTHGSSPLVYELPPTHGSSPLVYELPPTHDSSSLVYDMIKKKTKCDKWSCVLNDPTVKAKVSRDVLDEVRKNIKADGPSHSTKLLSNFNIDGVVSKLVNVPKHVGFLHIPFQMIDFNGSPGCEPTALGKLDICSDVICKGNTCMGVVLNTDTRKGRGKHWFSIFCDFRGAGSISSPYTIEYFNSSGGSPYKQVLQWLIKTVNHIRAYEFDTEPKKRHAVYVVATDVQHQKSDTECGPYSIYYIWSRLNNIQISEFNKPIPDDDMIKFRQHLFE